MTDEAYWALEPIRCTEEGGVWDTDWEWCDYWSSDDFDWYSDDWAILRAQKPVFKFKNMMIDVSKKTAFDRYFRSHMNKAPT